MFKVFNQNRQRNGQKGFLLPSVILLAVAISIMGVTSMQMITSTSSNLNTQYYNQLAGEAAEAGLSAAVGCVKNGRTWTTLTPGVDCMGASVGTTNVAARENWTSTYTVSAPVTSGSMTIVSSTGAVTLNGTTQSFTATLKKSLATGQVVPVATGQTVTAIAADSGNCSIANGVLYCWGENSYGQLGTGDRTSRSVPTAVARGPGQVFENLRVTAVTVGSGHVCAIASGQLYCWGRNADGQLGIGYASAYELQPRLVGGGLLGREVTKVSVSQGSSLNNYTCAIADGRVFCWGENANQQLGQATYINIPFLGCFINNATPNKGTSYWPIPVYGYNTNSDQCDGGSALHGKKATDISTGMGGACAIADGGMYCWGDLTQIALPAPPKKVDTGTLSGGKLVDGLLNSAGNTTCAYATGALHCKGFNMSFCGLLGCQPMVFLSGNITAGDNSDDAMEQYCLVSNGVPMCAGFFASGTGHGQGGRVFNPLTPTSAILGKVATGIATSSVGFGAGGGCVVANGSLACWGNNNYGQLGNGTTTYSMYPTNIVSGSIGTADGTAAATNVNVGTSHACGIANGQIYCWGDNTYGQLGNGTTTAKTVPTSPSSLTGVVASKVSAGDRHTCGLANGQVYCWGDNTYGQLGNGTTGGTQLAPNATPVGGPLAGKIVVDISTGATSTCAIADSQAYCWGNNATSQLGFSTSPQTVRNAPTAVGGQLAGKAVTSISAGTNHACAVANGSAYCWGLNASGATGLNTTSGTQTTPQRLTAGTIMSTSLGNLSGPTVTQIAAGNAFTCAIVNGTAACWGAGASGQLGNGTNTAAQATAVNVNGPDLIAGSLVDTISVGNGHACAGGRGEAYCWGAGASYQIGNNSNSNRNVPTRLTLGGLASGASVTQVATGGNTSCAVANGRINCWGLGTSGQIGNGGSATAQIPTTTSNYFLMTPTGVGLLY